ncbi:hypothetical protein AG1IA_09557 [Rhizoctonia solani AG-1 IA]|uniref:Uncharacterized protein n=1 Tax=Thanatephorus cucumeris (strain AG1-IA) TaxID=983506 RepID=L8WI64_THACA|nr:hypothetical protein AG1IA_09557 [Rhizoctonia solani AG-1 IA]
MTQQDGVDSRCPWSQLGLSVPGCWPLPPSISALRSPMPVRDPRNFPLEYRFFVCKPGTDGVDRGKHACLVFGNRVHELIDPVTRRELDRISRSRQSLPKSDDNSLFPLDFIFFAFESVPGPGYSFFLLAHPRVEVHRSSD